MFSVADAALFRPLPFSDPERLVLLPTIGTEFERSAPAPYQLGITRARTMHDVFESVGAYATGQLDLSGGAEPVRVRVAEVTPNLFGILGVLPRIGRPFSRDEELPGAANVAILSYGLWQREFGGDRDIIGKRVELNARRYEVIGVMPPRFSFPSASEVWIPYTVPLTSERTEIFRMLVETVGIAKLAPGVTIERAAAQAAAEFAARRARSGTKRALRLPLFPLREYFAGDIRSRVAIVSGLVILVVLMACVNVAGLLVARSISRRREMAIRKAIGAGRGRLVWQLLTESLVLAVCGAALGIGVASLMGRLFLSLTPPDLASMSSPRLDLRVLIATLSVSVLTALAFGVLPSLVATRQSPAEALKSGGRAGGLSRGTRRMSSALVAAEVSLAVVLLVGSGLMLRSLARLFAVETGLHIEHLVTANVTLPRARYLAGFTRQRFLNDVISQLSSSPGIQSAAAVNFLPLAPDPVPGFLVEARSNDSTFAVAGENVHASEKYFSTMGIRFIAGRPFTAADSATHVAAINESLARNWPPGKAIGGLVSVGNDSTPRTIVAVVSDIKTTALDGKQSNQIYTPLEDRPPARMTIVVRGVLSSDAMFLRIRNAVHSVDARQAISDLQTMTDVANRSVAARTTSSQLVIAFGVFALLLSGIGVYGLLAFTVSERMPEFGIRIALGAHALDIFRLVLAQAFSISFLGATVGAIAAFALARLIRSMLFEVSPADPLVYVLAPLAVLTMAAIAAFHPGRRAVAADPLETMRAE